MLKVAVTHLQGKSYMSLSEEQKIGNMMLKYPSRDFSSVLWWERFRFSVSEMKITYIFYLCTKRGATQLNLCHTKCFDL